MRINNIKFKLLSFIYMLLLSCSFQDDETMTNSFYQNTLNKELQGAQGAISEYFYNFENDVNAKFFRYNPNLMANYDSYSDYYSLFNEDPTVMNFKTFPDYLLSMTADEKNIYTKRNYIDSLSVADSVVFDSVQMNSTPFKNIESLQWNLDAEPSLQRYKVVNSDWIVSDTMIFYSDTFDVSAYWSVVDTPFIESGMLFVDSSEWSDTDYVFISDDPIRFLNTFEFTKKQLSSDSIVFRVNTDCNDNGSWDGAESILTDFNNDGIYEALFEYYDNNSNGVYDSGDEIIDDYDGNDTIGIAYEFEDRGNSVWDPDEVYFDIDSSGTYDLNEPYQDRNCNNKWDGEEIYYDDDNSGDYTLGDSFIDRGNLLFDGPEDYTLRRLDSNESGDTLLYVNGEKPNNLIVDWSDPSNPKVMLNILLGDSVVTRWGEVYTNIIEETDYFDIKQELVDDVDSLVTLFTREEIGHINSDGSSLDPDDYYITKSQWTKSAGGQIERFYNYHIFHQPDHLNQVNYPSYFLPIGFYFGPNEIEDGFWKKKNLETEVLYYTSNGYLRDGEMVDTAYYDTTDIAVYFIEKSYRVVSDDVQVPAGNRPDATQPAKDTTFTDCFKITHTTTMTMVGTGVDFGQKTISWLVKGKGMVKSEVYVRWTEHPYDNNSTLNNSNLDSLNQAWVGLNRIELNSVNIEENNGLLRRFSRSVGKITLKNIEDHPDFYGQPFYRSTQSGLHTLDMNDLNE